MAMKIVNKLLCGLTLIPSLLFAQEDFSKLKLEGKAPEGLNKIYLLYYDFDTNDQRLDSSKVENGTFKFNIEGSGVAYAGLYFLNDFNKPQTRVKNDFWFQLNPGTTIIDAREGKPKIVGGGKLTQDYLAYAAKNEAAKSSFNSPEYLEYNKKIQELNNQISAIQQERDAKFGSLRSVFTKNMIDFIKSNPSNTMSLTFVESLNNDENKGLDIKALFNSLDEKIKNSNRGKRLVSSLKANELVVGGQAFDFQQADINGKPVKLSDFKGKYVLLDFWASWCVPCREENPNVVKEYAKYKDKNFEIVAISLDNKKENWLKAIQDDKLTWVHLSDLQGWKNEVSVMYGVKGVPTNFLISPEGKILATDLRGDALGKFLEKTLK